MKRFAAIPICLLFVAALTACSADRPLNPAFPLTVDQARSELREMAASPQPLERPVIVLGGYLDPGFLTSHVADVVRRVTHDDRVLCVNFAMCGDFDDCRERVLQRVREQWPELDSSVGGGGGEVDVIAISMGGLVARYASLDDGDAEDDELRIRRLFTIATPHRGAAMAGLPTLNRCQLDMRAGSGFLSQLDECLPSRGYELFCYVRLDDAIVGPENAAPADQAAWWVAPIPLQFSHLAAPRDPRILADIGRRLRGETAYAIR